MPAQMVCPSAEEEALELVWSIKHGADRDDKTLEHASQHATGSGIGARREEKEGDSPVDC